MSIKMLRPPILLRTFVSNLIIKVTEGMENTNWDFVEFEEIRINYQL